MPRFSLPPATAEQLLSGAAPSEHPGELAADQYGAPYRSDAGGRFIPLGGPTYPTLAALCAAPLPAAGEMRCATTLGFHTPGGGGGGPFWWDSTRPKADHNGGTVVDPGKGSGLAEGVWPGTWFTPATTGAGCWIKEIAAISIRDFGAKIDGTSSDSAAIRSALQYGASTGSPVYFPAGTSINDDPLPFSPVIPAFGALHLYGDGMGVSIVKDAPGVRTAGMLRFRPSVGAPVESVSVKNMTWDKSGSATTPPPENIHAYEQAHCIAVMAGDADIKTVVFENVSTKDIMGGGIVFTGGTIDNAIVYNCRGTDRSYTGGARGDLEFQASVGNLLVAGCAGKFVQSEPNVDVPFGGKKPIATFIGCFYEKYDLIGYSGAPKDQTYVLKGCVNGESGDFWVRSGRLFASHCVLRSGDAGVDWRNAHARIDNSVVVIGVNTETNSFYGLPFGITDVTEQKVTFSSCEFIPDATVNESTTGHAISGSSGALPQDRLPNYLITFEDCEFSPLFERTAFAYRNGGWEFKRCKLVSRAGSYAINTGSDSAGGGSGASLLIEDCDLSRVQGDLIRLGSPSTSGTFSMEFSGAMDYAKFRPANRPPSEWQSKVRNNAIWTATGIPAGPGVLGQLVRVTNSVIGTGREYVCTSGSLSAATWRMSVQNGILSGASGARPTLTAADVGAMYRDTSLGGATIWWTGTAWVDATGAVV